MSASYPSSAKTFTTKSNATTADASHINDVQAEITAIEQDLIAGLPIARGGTANTTGGLSTWTPVIGGAGGTTGQTYTVQVGRAFKIGQIVLAWFNCKFSAKGTITGNVQIQGLPYTALNITSLKGMSQVEWYTVASNFVYVSGEVTENTTVAPLFGATAAAGSLTALTTSDLDDDSQVLGLLMYLATA